MSLFKELKRRNVFRVGFAYLVAAWLLLQIIDVIGPILHFSDEVARYVLFLVAIGFIPALILGSVGRDIEVAGDDGVAVAVSPADIAGEDTIGYIKPTSVVNADAGTAGCTVAESTKRDGR